LSSRDVKLDLLHQAQPRLLLRLLLFRFPFLYHPMDFLADLPALVSTPSQPTRRINVATFSPHPSETSLTRLIARSTLLLSSMTKFGRPSCCWMLVKTTLILFWNVGVVATSFGIPAKTNASTTEKEVPAEGTSRNISAAQSIKRSFDSILEPNPFL
jgi:hypothetical protein